MSQPVGTVLGNAGSQPAISQRAERLHLHRAVTVLLRFGGNGKVFTDFNASTDWLSRIAVQPDGKIVAIGDTHPSHRAALARYNPDGTLDPTFGNGGKVIAVSSVRESASGLLLLPDGKI